MSGEDIDLEEMLGPDPEPVENLVDEAPPLEVPFRDMSGKAVLARSRSYPVQRAARKNTPERLKRALEYVAEVPVGADVARRLGISYTTLKYWLQKSSEGAPGDGFDVTMGDDDENGTDDNTVRFHDAWDIAMMAGVERVEVATIRRATGYDETLTYQGRVQYKYDPAKLAQSRALGLPEETPENYLLDQYGAPVPETVFKMDPDLAMFILKSRKPQIYGNKAQVDVSVRGGVLVVPMRAALPTDLNAAEEKFRREGRPLVTFEEGDDEDV
jgi:hypothetical protein